MAMPKISSYRKYSASNAGINSIKLDLGNLVMYYNYGNLNGFVIRDREIAVVAGGNWRQLWAKNDEAAMTDVVHVEGFDAAKVARVGSGAVDRAFRQAMDTKLPSVIATGTLGGFEKDYAIKTLVNHGLTSTEATHVAIQASLGNTVVVAESCDQGTARNLYRALYMAEIRGEIGDCTDDKDLLTIPQQ